MAFLEEARAESDGEELDRTLIEAVQRFGDAGETWDAVRAALWLGESFGARRGTVRGEAKAVVALYEDADRGRKPVAGGKKGAERKHGDYHTKQEQARARYVELRAEGVKRTAASRRVAAEVGYDPRHVRRLTRDVEARFRT